MKIGKTREETTICMVCGVRNTFDAKGDPCMNGHTNWLTMQDVKARNEWFYKFCISTGLRAGNLHQLFMNSTINFNLKPGTGILNVPDHG